MNNEHDKVFEGAFTAEGETPPASETPATEASQTPRNDAETKAQDDFVSEWDSAGDEKGEGE